MDRICPKCSLPRDLCICGQITKEETLIKIKIERRRYGRKVTIIEGLDPDTDFTDLLSKLKSSCACGGTLRENHVELQGDHRRDVMKLLAKWGFPAENLMLQ